MADRVGARCPVCNSDVDPPLDKTFPCGRCHVLYHRRCWNYVRACAIYGCGWSGRRARRVAIEPARFPPLREPAPARPEPSPWRLGWVAATFILFALSRAALWGLKSTSPLSTPTPAPTYRVTPTKPYSVDSPRTEEWWNRPTPTGTDPLERYRIPDLRPVKSDPYGGVRVPDPRPKVPDPRPNPPTPNDGRPW